MQPRFSEENYATQFVRQRLAALFKEEQPSVFPAISKQHFSSSKMCCHKKTYFGHYLGLLPTVLQFEICMIHIDRGRKAPSGAFAKKFFPLPSVPICWPTSYCVHDSYIQILGRHLWFLPKRHIGILPKKTVHKFFFSAACAYLGLLPIVCMIYKTNSGFAKRQFTSFFLCRLCL